MRDLLQTTRVPDVDRLVAGAVVHDGHRILSLRRSVGDDFLPGIEELPSGGCESGESLEEGLWRELAEEIGWSQPAPLEDGFVATFDYSTGDGRRARQYTFSLPLGSMPIRLSDEHSSWRWLAPDDLPGCDMTAESAEVARQWWRWQGTDV